MNPKAYKKSQQDLNYIGLLKTSFDIKELMPFDVDQEMLRYCIWSGPHEEHKKKSHGEVVQILFFFFQEQMIC
jgi:hypothetical protein